MKTFNLRASKKFGQNFLIDSEIVEKIVIQGDILKINVADLFQKNFKVVANLPYYITTQILLNLIEKNLPITKIVTMVQKEVAERIISSLIKKSANKIAGGMNY